ncbi:hypothetical protein BU25DRAFT_374167, partial [Macroventuria anomochaeta]
MPVQRSNREIPHSATYGDTYTNGTCYDGDVPRPWDLDARNMPYLTHVKLLSRSWPTLRHLADFMEVGTSPLQWRYLSLRDNQEERNLRIKKTEVTFIEYQPETAPQVMRIDSAEGKAGLKEKLDSLTQGAAKTPPLRLFIVEDLSREVIELLGSRFDVDPLFFREHIEDYVWHNTRDPWAMPPSLTSSTRQQNSFEDARWEANKWNVLRRPDNDNNHWAHKDQPGAVVSIMRTRTTIWIGKDRRCGNGTVGIVLLDPTLKQGKPLWHDRTNWLPTTSMEISPPPIELSKSWYDDIVQMTTVYPWFEAASGHKIEPQVLAYPTLFTICAEWLLVCDYVKTRLSQIEWEVEIPDVFRHHDDTRSKSEVIADSLQRLHTWRRHIPVFRDMVNEAIKQALPAATRLTSHLNIDGGATDAFEDIKPDFERVLKALEELQDRVDRLTEVVTSEISLNDSRQSIEDNHNLTRLTWLATIFIPLSFVSAFFSMNESVADLKYTYGWFFLTAIPFTAICLAIAQLAGGGAL